MKAIGDCHVLVTSTSFGRFDPLLKRELEEQVGKVSYNESGKPLSSAELVALIPDVDGYIAGLDIIDRTVLEAANRLQVVARYGVGTDRVDLGSARELGIIVTNTPGANAVSVAELTVVLILNLLRPVMDACEQTRSGGWPRTSGLTLEGKTVGLIGIGAIGQEVARRLNGFACHLLVHDVLPDMAFLANNNVHLVRLDELLARSNIVSLHIPVLPQTKHMINASFLSKMKEGSYLINTARGELVDEDALFEAIRLGHLAGAALDAFAHEPPGVENALLSLPQVIPTPHMGAHTDGAANAMGWMALRNCLSVLKGEEALNRVV
jgi:D-3-phosphoglycerate dehydrogenase